MSVLVDMDNTIADFDTAIRAECEEERDYAAEAKEVVRVWAALKAGHIPLPNFPGEEPDSDDEHGIPQAARVLL